MVQNGIFQLSHWIRVCWVDCSLTYKATTAMSNTAHKVGLQIALLEDSFEEKLMSTTTENYTK